MEIVSHVAQGDCLVATVLVHAKAPREPENGYSVAVRGTGADARLTRISGEALGDASDAFFDTDDPSWENTCPAR